MEGSRVVASRSGDYPAAVHPAREPPWSTAGTEISSAAASVRAVRHLTHHARRGGWTATTDGMSMSWRVEPLVALLVLALGSGAAAQSPSPPGLDAGVRLYLPEARIALTIPAGWTVSVDHRPAQPPPAQSTPVDERWAVLSTSQGADTVDGCRLWRYPTGGLSLPAFASGLIAPDQASAVPVRLEAGEALRLDLDLGVGHVGQQYLIESDDSFYQLACVADAEVVDAAWLAIAESVEFLPPE